MQGQDAFPVIPYGNNTFGASFDPNVRIVFSMEGDRVTKVSLHQGGAVMVGVRK
jgi:hypothetical protein